jgi:hypothetical protein
MMNATARLAIVPMGLSLGSFLVITYVLCVLFGILVSDRGMHQLLALLPGFTWITWPSFFLGLLSGRRSLGARRRPQAAATNSAEQT